jgi:hypothetical protein
MFVDPSNVSRPAGPFFAQLLSQVRVRLQPPRAGHRPVVDHRLAADHSPVGRTTAWWLMLIIFGWLGLIMVQLVHRWF